MAGPKAAVLFGHALNPRLIDQVRTVVKQRAAVVAGDDCWVDKRPFIVSMGEEYTGANQELVDRGFPALLGWHQVDTVWVAAMCNDDLDHRLLAELCLLIAKTVDGVIDFCGELVSGQEVPLQSCCAVSLPSGLSGRLWLFREREGGYINQVGDAAFLTSWMRSKHFRMIK